MSLEFLTVDDILVAMAQNVSITRRILGADLLQHSPHPIDKAFEIFSTKFYVVNLVPFNPHRVVISLLEEFSHKQDGLTTRYALAKTFHFHMDIVDVLPDRRVAACRILHCR